MGKGVGGGGGRSQNPKRTRQLTGVVDSGAPCRKKSIQDLSLAKWEHPRPTLKKSYFTPPHPSPYREDILINSQLTISEDVLVGKGCVWGGGGVAGLKIQNGRVS